MERTHKIWGERWLIREDSTHAISFLIVKKGFRCSWHNHQAKYNLFVVVSGQIGILTEHAEIILFPGQEFTTTPGEWHEFRAYENSELIEEMYVEYSEEDINRKNIGGVFDISKFERKSKNFGRLSFDELEILSKERREQCQDQY